MLEVSWAWYPQRLMLYVRARDTHAYAPLRVVGTFFTSTKWGGVPCVWGWGCCWNSHVIQTTWPLCVANSVETEDGAEILNCPVFDVVTRCSIFSFGKMILINILLHLYHPWGLLEKPGTGAACPITKNPSSFLTPLTLFCGWPWLAKCAQLHIKMCRKPSSDAERGEKRREPGERHRFSH